MEFAMEDDDVFFADLSHRISLLITEDDDDDDGFPVPVKYPVTVPIQAYANQPFFTPTHPFFYDTTTYRRETKGTGVFIPKSSVPKRKNRYGRTRHNGKNKAAAAAAAAAAVAAAAANLPCKTTNTSKRNNLMSSSLCNSSS